MNKDIKYLGVPNVCFSLTEKNDDREKMYSKERISRGFDDSETWSLTNTIASFLIPRLERYIEITKEKEYNDILTMLKLVDRDGGSWIFTDEEKKKIEVGLESLKNNFFNLWW